MKVAAEGDHYRLAFDKPGTWSQKYNLVWDRILGLNIFPPSVARKEVAHYKKVMLRYGVPLDSRTHLTKTDWSFWSATLAENQSDFEAIIAPIYDYLNETTARDPIADSYVTDNIHSGGMHARPVVGGFFIKMLTDRDRLEEVGLARQAQAGELGAAARAAEDQHGRAHRADAGATRRGSRPTTGRNPTSTRRAGRKAGPDFGTNPPGFVQHTLWNTDDIWLRREITRARRRASAPAIRRLSRRGRRDLRQRDPRRAGRRLHDQLRACWKSRARRVPR